MALELFLFYNKIPYSIRENLKKKSLFLIFDNFQDLVDLGPNYLF